MRRLALPTIAALSLAFVSACSGSGGTGFASGSIDHINHVNFKGVGGQANVFFVAPNGQALLGLPGPAVEITAQGTLGTQQIIVPDSTFAWDAGFTTGNVFYSSNNEGQLKPCGTATPAGGGALPDISVFSPSTVLYYQAQGGVFTQLTPGVHTNTIFVVPPGPTGANGVIPAPAPAPQNYCITILAVGNGASANVQVVVSNSP